VGGKLGSGRGRGGAGRDVGVGGGGGNELFFLSQKLNLLQGICGNENIFSLLFIAVVFLAMTLAIIFDVFETKGLTLQE